MKNTSTIEYARDENGQLYRDGLGEPIPAECFENEPYSAGLGESVESYLRKMGREYLLPATRPHSR